MKRKLIAQLENWKNLSQKRPLLLTGAKGTGKTYLALYFATTFYKQNIYINFEYHPVHMESIKEADKKTLAAFLKCLSDDRDADSLPEYEISDREGGFIQDEFYSCEGSFIQNKVSSYNGSFIQDEVSGCDRSFIRDELSECNGIFILDEVPDCSGFEILTALLTKYYPQWDILAISSREIISGREMYGKDTTGTSTPFFMAHLTPLDFEEFLVACGYEWYAEVIREHYRKGSQLPEIVHKELLQIFEDYLYIGGMPLAVNEFITTGHKGNVRAIHKDILYSYLFEAGQKCGDSCGLKVKQMLFSLPEQLSKKNKKFQYTLIRKGATEAEYGEANDYIRNTFTGIRCDRLSEEKTDCPEETVEARKRDEARKKDESRKKASGYKLYLFDVGLYYTLSRLNGIPEGEEFRKGLIETFTAQALTAAGKEFGYWDAGSQAHNLFLLKQAKEDMGTGEPYPGKEPHLVEKLPLAKELLPSEELLPAEVREFGSNRSKCLLSFWEKHGMKKSFRISTDNFFQKDRITGLPLYSIFSMDLKKH